jgi:probable HAF family extracellular repeat protein
MRGGSTIPVRSLAKAIALIKDQKRAFVYTDGQLVQLDTLAQNLNEAGFTSLDVAYAINDKGWIVGYGTTSDNLTGAFVAVPERGTAEQQVPAPPPQARKQKQVPPRCKLRARAYLSRMKMTMTSFIQGFRRKAAG